MHDAVQYLQIGVGKGWKKQKLTLQFPRSYFPEKLLKVNGEKIGELIFLYLFLYSVRSRKPTMSVCSMGFFISSKLLPSRRRKVTVPVSSALKAALKAS